jgi:hypothetical protein
MSPSAVRSQIYRIASIPADGIGPEVIGAGLEVLKALTDAVGTFEVDVEHFDWSSDVYKKTGKYIPDGGLDQLKQFDAILFGAVGAPGETSTRRSGQFWFDVDSLHAVQMFRITFRSGVSGSPSANRYSSMPTSARPRSSAAYSLLCGTARSAISTGSLYARTAKASTPAKAGGRTWGSPGRRPPNWPSSRGMASSAS